LPIAQTAVLTPLLLQPCGQEADLYVGTTPLPPG
jgi:hypothetical protein